MKILYITHQLAFNFCGGAEIQLIKTMQNINQIDNGVTVKLYDMLKDKIEDYDVIHIFAPKAFPLESFKIAKYAKDKNLKVVISPIFYENPKMLKEVNGSKLPHIFWEFLVNSRNFISKTKFFEYMDPYKFFENTLRISDAILPNTNEELNLLLNRFSGISKHKCFMIPNGVDSKFKYADSKLFTDKYGFDDFILFVGRIEPRKNILRLIKAFGSSKLETKLLIIGKAEDINYYKLCKNNATENVIFISPLPNNSEMLKSAYKAAKVLALPSYLETPGLAALEGGLSGANIVITKIGGTKEYFGKHAWYVDPLNEKSIQNSLISAFNSPKSNVLSEKIEKNFSWDIIAKKTLDVYNLII